MYKQHVLATILDKAACMQNKYTKYLDYLPHAVKTNYATITSKIRFVEMQSVVNLKMSSLTVCVSEYKHSFMINSQIWYVYVYKCVSVCVTGPSLSSRPVGACRGCKSACSTDKLFVIG